MTEIYQYRTGYRGSRKVSAEVVAGELERIRETGDITSERVLEEATPKKAPLHPAFQWDDQVAAHEFRLEQARRLVRAIVVIPAKGQSGSPTSFVVHVPDPVRREGRYVPLSSVVDDTDDYERALSAAKRHLDAAEHRFQELRRLAEGRGERTEALALAVQGFAVVREAIELLR